MKTRILFLFLALTGLTFGFSLDWFTIDGGGDASTGGVYSVKGTIGQPDAGGMSGGTYTIEGGFWSSPEPYQVPGGPPLSLARAGATNVLLSWPAASPGWVLEKSGDLVTWTPAGGSVVLQSGQNTVTVPSQPGRQYFRLRGP